LNKNNCLYFQDTPVPDRSVENDIELAASLATLHVLQNRGVKGIKVKWLNDLWIHGHKLLGALAEFKSLIKGNTTVQVFWVKSMGQYYIETIFQQCYLLNVEEIANMSL